MEFHPGHTVGIDLGTTFSTIAYLDETGNPVPIPNDDDEVETPSLILLADSGRVIVGPSRSMAAMEKPDKVVERIKRYMGNADFKRTFDGREITPEFISALILKKLRQDAERRIGKIGNAVVTVPYYFNDARRKATQDAGRIAGIHVVDIINEPTAATLTYAWKQGELGATGAVDRPRLALVYDLGGGTFDVTVVRYTPTHFQVLATDGDVHLGGVDWNDRLADYVADEFKAKHGADPRSSEAVMQLLRHDCDQAKVVLTQSPKVTISCRHEGKSLSVPMSRDHFEELTADLVQRTLDTSELVLQQAGVSPDDLDAVVLVGGSTLMPRISQAIEQTLGKAPYRGISPHTAVAQGAAIHAAILEVRHRGEASEQSERIRKLLGSVKQEDVNSHGLGVAAKNPKTGKVINNLMIRRNSKLPIEARKTFVTSEPNQRRVTIKVLEGDAPDPDACSLLGNCRIVDLPENLPKGSPIEVTYRFDTDGRVHVSARETNGGREASIQIERRSGLTEDQIHTLTALASDYHVE